MGAVARFGDGVALARSLPAVLGSTDEHKSKRFNPGSCVAPPMQRISRRRRGCGVDRRIATALFDPSNQVLPASAPHPRRCAPVRASRCKGHAPFTVWQLARLPSVFPTDTRNCRPRGHESIHYRGRFPLVRVARDVGAGLTATDSHPLDRTGNDQALQATFPLVKGAFHMVAGAGFEPAKDDSDGFTERRTPARELRVQHRPAKLPRNFHTDRRWHSTHTWTT
jgi:hypothetical protein